jgi:hypothetical protein
VIAFLSALFAESGRQKQTSSTSTLSFTFPLVIMGSYFSYISLFGFLFLLVLKSCTAAGTTGLALAVSPVGPNFLFGTTLTYTITYNAAPMPSNGSCDLAVQPPGSTASSQHNVGCNFSPFTLLLVGQYNISLTYTFPNGTSSGPGVWQTVTVTGAPLLIFAVAVSNLAPTVGSSLTVSSKFSPDLTTMDGTWAATKPTITGI